MDDDAAGAGRLLGDHARRDLCGPLLSQFALVKLRGVVVEVVALISQVIAFARLWRPKMVVNNSTTVFGVTFHILPDFCHPTDKGKG